MVTGNGQMFVHKAGYETPGHLDDFLTHRFSQLNSHGPNVLKMGMLQT